MPFELYSPSPVPESASPEVREYLENELETIAYWINLLRQYNESNP